MRGSRAADHRARQGHRAEHDRAGGSHRGRPARVLRMTWNVRGLPCARGRKIPARVSSELTGTITTAATALSSRESSFLDETRELAPLHPQTKNTASQVRIASFATS